MSQKSTKAQDGATTTIQLKFDGGLNYASSPSQIADNELTRAMNYIYNSQTGTPEVRPGSVCVTTAALPAPIRKIYYYEKDATHKWLLAVSGLKLYRLNVNAWVEIGTNIIASTSVAPTFITYNTHLLMADGSVNLRKWDGSLVTELTDGLNATAIAEIGGRVVINSSVDPDLVTFSGIEDETMWDTADLANPAIGLRAGFGDNMEVNGFAVFGFDLIASKKGDAEKRFYRITTSAVPTEWTVNRLIDNNAAQNAQSIVSAFNNIYFVDSNGFKNIKGVTEYGDLQIDMIGSKINTVFGNSECLGMTYLPKYTAIWYMLLDRVYCCHLLVSPDGTTKYAFTDLAFQQGTINSVMQAGDTVYLAGNNGHLYSLLDSAVTDEVTPAVSADYPTVLITKRFNFPDGGLLRLCLVEFKALNDAVPSIAYVRASTPEKNGTLIRTVDVLTAGKELYADTGDLYDATGELGTVAGMAWMERSTNRVRGTAIQFQVDSTSGRFGLEGLTAEIALVGR